MPCNQITNNKLHHAGNCHITAPDHEVTAYEQAGDRPRPLQPLIPQTRSPVTLGDHAAHHKQETRMHHQHELA